jgi:hypothetical protein
MVKDTVTNNEVCTSCVQSLFLVVGGMMFRTSEEILTISEQILVWRDLKLPIGN